MNTTNATNQTQASDLAAASAIELGSKAAALGAVSSSKTDIYQVPFKDLVVLPIFDLRTKGGEKYRENVDSKKASIIAVGGIKAPLQTVSVVMADGQAKLAVLNGMTRHDALSELIRDGVEGFTDESTVPVEILHKNVKYAIDDDLQFLDLKGLRLLQLSLNVQQDFDPLAKGVLIDELIKSGLDIAKVCSAAGVSVMRGQQLLKVVSAGKEVQDLIRQDLISFEAAFKLLQQHGQEKGVAAIKLAVESKGGAPVKLGDTQPQQTKETRALLKSARTNSAAIVVARDKLVSSPLLEKAPPELRDQVLALIELLQAEKKSSDKGAK